MVAFSGQPQVGVEELCVVSGCTVLGLLYGCQLYYGCLCSSLLMSWLQANSEDPNVCCLVHTCLNRASHIAVVRLLSTVAQSLQIRPAHGNPFSLQVVATSQRCGSDFGCVRLAHLSLLFVVCLIAGVPICSPFLSAQSLASTC